MKVDRSTNLDFCARDRTLTAKRVGPAWPPAELPETVNPSRWSGQAATVSVFASRRHAHPDLTVVVQAHTLNQRSPRGVNHFPVHDGVQGASGCKPSGKRFAGCGGSYFRKHPVHLGPSS